jgi:hypothetical protein
MPWLMDRSAPGKADWWPIRQVVRLAARELRGICDSLSQMLRLVSEPTDATLLGMKLYCINETPE